MNVELTESHWFCLVTHQACSEEYASQYYHVLSPRVELKTFGVRRQARADLSKRPWRIDTFDELAAKWFSNVDLDDEDAPDVPPTPFRRVIMFVDNAGKFSFQGGHGREP